MVGFDGFCEVVVLSGRLSFGMKRFDVCGWLWWFGVGCSCCGSILDGWLG